MSSRARRRVRLTSVGAVAVAALGTAVAGATNHYVPGVAQRVCDPDTLAAPCPILIPAQPAATPRVVMTAATLRRYASAGRRLYWAGPKPRTRYELSESADGGESIRYLPAGALVGTQTADRTIVTSPLPDAFAIVHTYGQTAGAVRVTVRRAVAFYYRTKPTRVYLAFRDVPYEIEVSDPAPGAAIALVRSGRIRPVA